MSDPIPKHGDRKPDPDEPWRYVTPCCRAQPQSEASTKLYVCPSCRQSYEEGDLVDLKMEGER